MRRFYQYLKKKYWKEQWTIGVAPLAKEDVLGNKGDLSKTQWLFEEKKNGFFADPFTVKHNNETYIFFEQFDDIIGRGRISYIKLAIVSGKIKTTETKTALEKPFHLSYPFFIRENGELLMVPETAEANEIAAYRSTVFPDSWAKEKTLISNFPGIDPTIFKRDGRYWLFCTHAQKGMNDHLYAFYCDQLLGEWQPHEKNPIKIDLESARPAGPLFEAGGALFRPAQNCKGTYGKEIVINKIIELSPSDFLEEKVASLSPKSAQKYHDGIHTISFSKEFALIDGKRYVGIKKVLGSIISKIKQKKQA